MSRILRTADFDRWLAGLRDQKGKARIIARIRALERGHRGDCKALGGSLFELRIHCGPGYRVYVVPYAGTEFVLLCGGSKNRQRREIARARRLARHLERE
jgi:putative addiction module killer protein